MQRRQRQTMGQRPPRHRPTLEYQTSQAHPHPIEGLVTSRPKPNLFDDITTNWHIGTVDGKPDVTDLQSDIIEQLGHPYMERYFILGQPGNGTSTARYHHIVQSDTSDLHDHPWDFVSVILDGSYTETTTQGEQTHSPAQCSSAQPNNSTASRW